jgi:hypothetical protein
MQFLREGLSQVQKNLYVNLLESKSPLLQTTESTGSAPDRLSWWTEGTG